MTAMMVSHHCSHIKSVVVLLGLDSVNLER